MLRPKAGQFLESSCQPSFNAGLKPAKQLDLYTKYQEGEMSILYQLLNTLLEMGSVSKCETTRFSPYWCTSDLAQILGVPEMSLLQRNGQNMPLKRTMTHDHTKLYETMFVQGNSKIP